MTPSRLNLDPAAAERAITPRSRAILVVHTFGVPAEMDAFRALASRHGLALIEDACEAIGAEFDGQRVGGFGDLAVLGFYPNKQITTGEGGAVLVRDPAACGTTAFVAKPGAHGAEWLDQKEIGYNYRLAELECALGRVQLGRIEEILAMRRAASERYHTLLEGIPGLALPPRQFTRRTISWFAYVVRITKQSRDTIQSRMAKQGIASGRYFPPIHRQNAVEGIRRGRSASLHRSGCGDDAGNSFIQSN